MNYLFETVTCNICGSDDFDMLIEKAQFGLPAHVGLCRTCGLGYLNPRWDNASYLNFYMYKYDKYYRPGILKKAPGAGSKENPIITRFKQKSLLPKEVSNILDIGSGGGANLEAFHTQFPDAALFAIEPSLESQKHLTTLGATLISDNVDSDWHNGHEAKFDIIIMRHVLEHFLDPLEVLKKVKSVLNPEGVLYIAVPNNLKPNQNMRNTWFRSVHVYYFNRFSLSNILRLTGLDALEIIEGDEHNQGELVALIKTAKNAEAPSFHKEHYITQKSIFEQRLKEEDRPLSKAAFYLKTIIRKLLG